MIVITNATNDRIAFIAHCSHEDIASFMHNSGMARKGCPVYPMTGTTSSGEFAVYSDKATHWTMEPSALKAFKQWLDDSGMYCQEV